MAKGRQPSRSQRWANAVNDAQGALSALDAAYSDLESALEELRDLQGEYQEWRDNLPENLANSALGEKLAAVADMDITDDPRSTSYDELEALLNEAEGAELPQGFGRD